MMGRSAIEWTEATWNPVTGCDKVSPGCKHCYAERMAIVSRHGAAELRHGFDVSLHEHAIELPSTGRGRRPLRQLDE